MIARPAHRIPPGLRAALPLPFEVAAAVGLITAVLFLRRQGLSIDWVTVRYTVPPLLGPVAGSLAAGVALYLLSLALRRRPVRPYLKTILTPGWLLTGLRIWVVSMVLSYTYIWLKISIPLINYRLWDELFWNLDRHLHLGFSPSIFWRELLAGSGVLPWIDRWYSFWVTTITLAIGFFCAYPRAEVRRQTILGTVLLWVVGAWLYMAMPALGPAYAYPEVWDGVRQEMPAAQSAQAALWQNYQRVLAGRDGPLKSFKPAYGIAAMPSLHVAGHFLLLLWIRRWARPLLLPAVLAVIATFVGSVVTGWHYAIDGYVGLLLAWAVYRLAIAGDRWLDLGAPRQPPPAAGEAPAQGSAEG